MPLFKNGKVSSTMLPGATPSPSPSAKKSKEHLQEIETQQQTNEDASTKTAVSASPLSIGSAGIIATNTNTKKFRLKFGLKKKSKLKLQSEQEQEQEQEQREKDNSIDTIRQADSEWPFGLTRDMDTASAPPPLPYVRLKQIATDACDAVLADVATYDHPKTDGWNTSIINSVLKALISETSPNSSTPPSYKFAINSTIIQHQASAATSAKPSSTDGSTSSITAKPASNRRGMHSATGAYWNNERDGMWSFKYEAGEGKGLDVVVCIIWIAL